jgi:hypothetical protein
MTIHDDRLLSIQLTGALAVEMSQEHINGSGQMLCLVFLLGKHLNQLRSL